MTELLGSYIPIAIFIGIALVIGIALLVAPFAVAYKAPDSEKLSAYECGFNAFDDARMKYPPPGRCPEARSGAAG